MEFGYIDKITPSDPLKSGPDPSSKDYYVLKYLPKAEELIRQMW